MSVESPVEKSAAKPALPKRPQPVPTRFSREFWEATRERRLVLQYCTVARKFQHYPRPVSIYTGRHTTEWREVSGKGSIYAFTETLRAPPAFRGREPYLIASIELDEGARIMSNLVDCRAADVKVGGRVQLRWDALENGMSYPVFALAK